jgi:hypothetical protein
VLGGVASGSAQPIAIEGRTWDADACFQESLRILDEAALQPERARTVEAWRVHRARLAGESDGKAER